MQKYTSARAVTTRTLVVVDGQNLMGSLKALGLRLSVRDFKVWTSNYGRSDIHWFQGDYPNLARLFGELRGTGIHIHTKKPKRLPSGAFKADMDVDLSVFAVENATMFERVILVSGDGDFHGLVKALDRMGRQVVILSYSNDRGVELLGTTPDEDMIDLETIASEFCYRPLVA